MSCCMLNSVKETKDSLSFSLLVNYSTAESLTLLRKLTGVTVGGEDYLT